MTIALFACESTVLCGPCPNCVSFLDLIRTGPNARVVIYRPDVGWTGTLTAGAVEYVPFGGGSPVSLGMTVVSAANKLCLGRNQSYDGQLVYTAAVPHDATVTKVGYTYTPAGGGSVSVLLDVVGTCTDGNTQILRILGALDCNAPPAVVAVATSCLGCSDPTGSESVGFYQGVWIYTDINFGITTCTRNIGVSSSPAVPIWNSYIIPAVGSRPCNWMSLDFAMTLTLTSVLSMPACGGSSTFVSAVVVTKTAGSDRLNLVATAVFSVSVPVVNQVPASSTPSPVSTTADIPCSGYRLRLSIGRTSSIFNPGSDYRMTHYPVLIIEPRP